MKGLLASVSLAGILALIAWGAHVFMHSKIFEVREVHASGLERLNEAEVIERLRPSSGTSLFDLDLVSLKGRLLAEPWIKEVSLRREYPDALSVRVIERRPAAVLADRTVTAIVDETGAVIEEWPNAREGASNLPEGPRNFPKGAGAWSSLPLIYGVEAASLKNRDPRAMQGILTAMELLREAPMTVHENLRDDLNIKGSQQALPGAAAGQASGSAGDWPGRGGIGSKASRPPHQDRPGGIGGPFLSLPHEPPVIIVVSQPDDVRIQRHGYQLRFGPGPFGEKWRRFLSVENEIERRHDAVREVDLRFPGQVIVR